MPLPAAEAAILANNDDLKNIAAVLVTRQAVAVLSDPDAPDNFRRYAATILHFLRDNEGRELNRVALVLASLIDVADHNTAVGILTDPDFANRIDPELSAGINAAWPILATDVIGGSGA